MKLDQRKTLREWVILPNFPPWIFFISMLSWQFGTLVTCRRGLDPSCRPPTPTPSLPLSLSPSLRVQSRQVLSGGTGIGPIAFAPAPTWSHRWICLDCKNCAFCSFSHPGWSIRCSILGGCLKSRDLTEFASLTGYLSLPQLQKVSQRKNNSSSLSLALQFTGEPTPRRAGLGIDRQFRHETRKSWRSSLSLLLSDFCDLI